LINNGITLSSVVNWVQGHACSKSYCLRFNKAKGVEECRFYLPAELLDEAVVAKHPSHSYMHFYPARNDQYLNKYNRLVTIGWQANTDVSPCTSTTAVMEYVVKYAGKLEKASQSYRELAQIVIPFVNEARPFQSMVTKLMNKLIGERDYAAQEVCHLLLSLPLKQSSRTPIYVDMRPLAAQPSLVHVEDGEARRGLSILEHYMRRPEDFDDVSYLKFLLSHKH
jgi:ATP-dependent DNA helicase PIF1